jgi:serine/threonine protein kinase
MTDDDRTRVIGSAGSAHRAAPEPDAGPTGVSALPIGTRLGEFEINELIGEGGFGIVYKAIDHSLGRPIALKEYMPSALASRTPGFGVAVRAERYRDTFEAGLRSFVTEAKILARFDHPSMVKVYRFWEERGTAYMVMPFYEGVTLKAALANIGGAPGEAWLRRFLGPVLDALQCLHEAQCLHRDIAPDNILLTSEGRPVLLDFGAARRVIGDMTQALTVILKPGYAPIEQYAEIPDMQQGPWTDVYALASVIYYCLSGKAPPPSVSRMVNDTVVPAVEIGRGRYTETFLAAVDAGLRVRPADRITSIAAFRTALGMDAHTTVAPEAGVPVNTLGIADPGASRRNAAVSPGASRQAPPPAGSAGDSGKSWWIVPGLAAAVIGAAGAIGVALYVGSGSAPPPSQPEVAAPAGSVTPPPLDGGGAAPDVKSTSKGTDTLATAPVAPLARPPFSPLAVLDLLNENRDPARLLTIAAPTRPVRIDVDPIRFSATSDRDGFLYVLMAGTDAAHFYQIFPNALDRDNRIVAGRRLALPRSSWTMIAGGPPGTNELIAIVSERPRSFERAGLRAGKPFSEFDLAVVETQWREAPDLRAAFAGIIDCPPPGGCEDGYAASRFGIREVPK